MPRPNPPHLIHERTRHGKVVWYVRRGQGPRIRLYPTYDTPAFWSAYTAALEGRAAAPLPKGQNRTKRPLPNTLAWLIGEYTASGEYKGLSKSTRANRMVTYRSILEGMQATNITIPVEDYDRTSVLAGRNKRADTPSAANAFVTSVHALFAWAIANGHAKENPAIGIKPLKRPNADKGHHAWTEAEIGRYEARWPLGTRERIILDVMLYTGMRIGDAAKFGPQHVNHAPDGAEFEIRTEKTDTPVIVPMPSRLARSLEAGPIGKRSFITREDGGVYDKGTLGRLFGNLCRELELPGTAHGLRKAGARRAAEDGATEAMLNALFGWADGSRQSSIYTRTANRKKLARAAANLQTHSPHPTSIS